MCENKVTDLYWFFFFTEKRTNNIYSLMSWLHWILHHPCCWSVLLHWLPLILFTLPPVQCKGPGVRVHERCLGWSLLVDGEVVGSCWKQCNSCRVGCNELHVIAYFPVLLSGGKLPAAAIREVRDQHQRSPLFHGYSWLASWACNFYSCFFFTEKKLSIFTTSCCFITTIAFEPCGPRPLAAA